VTDAVRALVPRIRAAADATEAERRVPRDVVDALVAAGVFRLCVPRALGGVEAHPRVLVDVLATIAAADGSTGWCAMIGATSGLVSAYLPEPIAREIYGDPRAVTGGVFAPCGTARAEGDAFRVSGRWPFASGSQYARLRAGRRGERPAAPRDAVPASDVASSHRPRAPRHGSHDMTVEDVLVPRRASVSLTDDRPRAAGALYAVPVFGLLALGIAAVALGIARGAVDELVRLAGEKRPQGSRRTLAERGVVQAQVAEAEALVRAARAFVHDAIDAWAARPTASSRRRSAWACGCRDARDGRARDRLGITPAAARRSTATVCPAPRPRRRAPSRDGPALRGASQAALCLSNDTSQPGPTTLRTERVGDVLKVTIAHPTSALNAVDEALGDDLTRLFADLRRESAARAVLLTGQGRAFSAGGDFAWFPSLQDPTRMEALRRDARQLIWDLVDVELPIVAGLNGPAMGLGASIALDVISWPTPQASAIRNGADRRRRGSAAIWRCWSARRAKHPTAIRRRGGNGSCRKPRRAGGRPSETPPRLPAASAPLAVTRSSPSTSS
jgi:alkylation response protein AidB-like acyl-CoA dehydrogenase